MINTFLVLHLGGLAMIILHFQPHWIWIWNHLEDESLGVSAKALKDRLNRRANTPANYVCPHSFCGGPRGQVTQH